MSTRIMALLAGIRSIVYVIGFVFLWGWVALAVRRLDARMAVALPDWLSVVGSGLMAIGAILAILCVFLFSVRGAGTPVSFDPPRRFVATGPYRYVRNPMYIAALLILVGFGLNQLSPSILGLAAALSFAAHCFVVYIEERGLERRFGDPYLRYKSRVNRWIPRWRG